MCRAYLKDTRTYSSIVWALSITCEFEPGRIVANAHSGFPIKSTLRLFPLSAAYSHVSSHSYLPYPSILVFGSLPPCGIDALPAAFRWLLQITHGNLLATENKKKGKKTREKKRQLKMFEIVSLCAETCKKLNLISSGRRLGELWSRVCRRVINTSALRSNICKIPQSCKQSCFRP